MLKPYQKEALQLAKRSILEEFGLDSLQNYKVKSKELLEKKASFVTLKILPDYQLRWCIGSLVPVRLLWEDIVINAKNAAFADIRFVPLSQEELPYLYVEISILSIPVRVEFSSIDELLKALKEKHPWVIIDLFGNRATFLPSVWKELPDENEFLRHLVAKAFISWDKFVNMFSSVEIYFYYTEEFWLPWEDIKLS